MKDASPTEPRQRARREHISTRVECTALETIHRVAELHRTTPAHVARVLLEDGARALQQQNEQGRAA